MNDGILGRLNESVQNTVSIPRRIPRMWKGRKYEVVVRGENKFELDGVYYTSLSAVARAITGTRWNGKIFFGVK